MLGIADAQIGLDAALARPAAGDLEHLRAELDAGEVYLRGIEVEVTTRADANLQHLAKRPRADPLPSGTKEHPLQKSDEPVVIFGSPVVVPPDTLRPVPVRAHPKTGSWSSRRPRTTRSRPTPSSSTALGKYAQGSKPNSPNSTAAASRSWVTAEDPTLQDQRRDQGEDSINGKAERERQHTVAHDVADTKSDDPQDGESPERLDHVGRPLAPGDGHRRQPLVHPERLRSRNHNRSLHDPVPAARRNKEADDIGGDKGPEGEGVLVRERHEPVGDDGSQGHTADREGHQALYPTVERILQGDRPDGVSAAGERSHVAYRGPVQDQADREEQGDDGVKVEVERARYDRTYEVGNDGPSDDEVKRPETLQLAGRRIGALRFAPLVLLLQKLAVHFAHLLRPLWHHPPVQRDQEHDDEERGDYVPPGEDGLAKPQHLSRLLLGYVCRAARRRDGQGDG